MHLRQGVRRTVALIGVVALVGGATAAPTGVLAEKDGIAKQAAQGHLRAPQITTPAGVTRTLPSLSGGTVNAARAALAAFSAQDEREQMADGGIGPDAAALGV